MTNSREDLHAEFIDGTQGPLFVLTRGHRSPGARWVLVVPPLFEEMNKSRRTCAVLTRELAKQGWVTAQVDLFGTGDSAGEISAASWSGWQADVMAAIHWIIRGGGLLDGVVAVRAGALLAGTVLGGSDLSLSRLALWQPVLKGDQYLSAFLRTRIAANAFQGRGGETVAGLKQALSDGQSVEVGGYALTRNLTCGLGACELEPNLKHARFQSAHLFEVATKPSPGIQAFADKLAGCGRSIETDAVPGPLFWATTEVTCHTDLVCRTRDSFHGRA